VQSDQRREIAISVVTVINQADHVPGTCCADFRTNMKPMKKLAKTLKERIDNIVTYCTHGITNGVAEGINSKIMSIKRLAGGYRNIENFKKAIFFYCGGLDLYPR
jgi:hypothetical protein